MSSSHRRSSMWVDGAISYVRIAHGKKRSTIDSHPVPDAPVTVGHERKTSSFESLLKHQHVLVQPEEHGVCISHMCEHNRDVPLSSARRSLRADIAVTLKTPLGIIFEEIEPGKPEGLIVAELV